MDDIAVDVPSPLRECFLHSEVECVRECCGIDAISTEAELIVTWGHQVGPETVAAALRQLAELISVVEDRTHKVLSTFLNHYTHDETGRRQLMDFLLAFQSALAGIV